jgi:CubicO group peptidase (beta-lactamase class C family)
MQPGLDRRSFLHHALAAPFLVPAWKSGPPRNYLSELSAMMRAGSIPGAVIGSLANRKPAWIAPLGVRAAGSSETVTAATLFQAASLTKQVAAHAAFALRAQGKLDLDKPLVAYVDDLRDPAARTVTARHVLSHSSGFPNWRQPEASGRVPELVPAFAPGSRYQYSGEGYFYLQRVLEEVTGKGIGQVTNELVFQPLGMTSSTVVWDPETLSRTALPHDRRGEPRKDWDRPARHLRDYAARFGKPVAELRYPDYSAARREAAGNILPNGMVPNMASSMVTSAEDYARFLAAAIAGPGIAEQQTRISDSLGWGLGWAVERTAGHTYAWQWGDNPGFKNIVLAEPSSGNAVFVFTNGDSGARVYDRVLTHATGHDHPLLFWL